MSGVGYACAVLLAGVFVVAAAAKLRTPVDTAATFRRLGIPAPRPLARAVPAVELLVAVTLLAAPRAGAAAAAALLVAFTGVLARAVARGLAVPCGCFGTASHAPITTTTLLRNALLVAAAGAALFADEPTVPSLADIVLVSTVAVLSAVALAAVDLKRTTGHVWKVDVPR